MRFILLFVALALASCAGLRESRAGDPKTDFRERYFVAAPIKGNATFAIVSHVSNDVFATEFAFALGRAGHVIKKNPLATLPPHVGRQVLAPDAWTFRDEYARRLLKSGDVVARTLDPTTATNILERFRDANNLDFDIERTKAYVRFVDAINVLQDRLGCDYIAQLWSTPTSYQIEITDVRRAVVAAMFRIDSSEAAWRAFIPALDAATNGGTLFLSPEAVNRRDWALRAIEYAQRVVARLGAAKE